VRSALHGGWLRFWSTCTRQRSRTESIKIEKRQTQQQQQKDRFYENEKSSSYLSCSSFGNDVAHATKNGTQTTRGNGQDSKAAASLGHLRGDLRKLCHVAVNLIDHLPEFVRGHTVSDLYCEGKT
jgi:hypothetical protein